MAFLLSKKFWLDLLFPVRCLSCKQENKDYLCVKCRTLLKFDSPNFKFNLKNIDSVFIAGNYENPLLADLIKKLKFNSIVELGKILGDFLSLFWQGQAGPENYLVIPIPLSKKRQRTRGFNQAEVIARYLALNFNYELSLNLKKIKNTKAQANLTARQRADNLTGSFIWTGEDLSGREIILIDDVITTGATMEAAAKTLKKAGTKKIIALGVAKG